MVCEGRGRLDGRCLWGRFRHRLRLNEGNEGGFSQKFFEIVPLLVTQSAVRFELPVLLHGIVREEQHLAVPDKGRSRER